MTKISLMTAATELDGTEMIEILQDGVNKKVPVNLLVIAGKSAYQLAVDAGYVGTMENWLLSLKGTPGENGQPGVQGPRGLTGTSGSGNSAETPVLIAELVSGGIDYNFHENTWNITVVMPSLDVHYDEQLRRFMFAKPGIYELNLVGHVGAVDGCGSSQEWAEGVSTLNIRIRAGYVATIPAYANSRIQTRQTDNANKNFPLGFSEKFYLNVKEPVSGYEGLEVCSVMMSESYQNNYHTKMGLSIKRVGAAYYAPVITYRFAESFGEYPTEYSSIEEATESFRSALQNNSETSVFVSISSTDLTVPGEYYTLVCETYDNNTGQFQFETSVQILIITTSTEPTPTA